MTSQETQPTSPDELGTLVSLEGLSGVEHVQSFRDGFSVTFPEADFVIRMSSPRSGPCETEWEVTVREPQPGLSTWWGRWHRSFSVHGSEAGPVIAAEVRKAISRVRSMLDDRARGLHDAAMPEL